MAASSGQRRAADEDGTRNQDERTYDVERSAAKDDREQCGHEHRDENQANASHAPASELHGASI
jgi:hypothetical protein